VNHRWAARILVVALHAALLAALWLHRPRGLAPDPARRATTVRLILPQLRLPPPANAAMRPAPRPAAPPVIAPQPVALDTPAAPDIAPDVTPAAPAAIQSTAATAEPPRTALRLTLPPGYAASSAAARNPALDDPRSNTPRLTLEDRIADATGGAGAWVEEKTSENNAQAVGALGEHRTVMRKGNICQEVFRSRISDTDPFNSSVAPRAGKMMGRQYKCR
jgi:hypothetical protein